MYQAVFNDKLQGKVIVWDDETGMTTYDSDRFRYAYAKKKGGGYKSIFGDDLERIEHYDDADPTLFESDLNVEMKALLDLYPNNEEISKGHRIIIYDIETSTEGGFPDVTLGDKPITAIALYDVSGDKYYSLILDREKKIQNSENGNVLTQSFDCEEKLLNYFLNLWRKINPTIISGWNINFFDNPYTFNRIRVVLGKQATYKLSPINVVYQNKFNRKMTIAGVSSLDYIDLYKKFLGVMKSSYSLSNVAKDEELKHQKLTYKGNLDELYKSDINRFIEYNLVDVKIVVELDKRYDFINLAQAVCHKGHIPYEWFQMSSRFIDGAILDYLHSQNLIGPNKPADGRAAYEEMEKSDDEGFEGAYVKEPIPGQYDWVCSADITSLYPSAIMTLNISPETKVGKILNWNFDAYNANTLTEVKIGELTYTIDEFKMMLQNNAISIASGGTMYRQNKVGVIPTILDRWFEERVEYRKLAMDFAKQGDKEKEAFYDRRQKRQKIFLNSVYGTLGLPIFRFYDRDNAEAVTLSGQSIIKGAEKVVNDTYATKFKAKGNDKLAACDNIIYIDTDSLYFSSIELGRLDNIPEDQMMDYTIKLVTDMANKINRFYAYMIPLVFNVRVDRNRIKIVPDVIAKKALWIAKKRYAMLKVYDMEKLKGVKDKSGEVGKLEVKGIDTVRSSYPPAFRRMVGKILEDLLRGKELSILDEEIMKFEENIQSFGQFDLAKTSSIKFISKKGDKHYNPKDRIAFEIIKGTPAQAKAGIMYNDLLKVWKLEKQVDLIRHGDKARWIYMLPNPFNVTQMAFKGDDTDPDKILEFVATYADKQEMYNKELKTKLIEIYLSIGRPFPNRGSQLASKTFNFDDAW